MWQNQIHARERRDSYMREKSGGEMKVPSSFYAQVNERRESVGGKRLTTKAFKTGLATDTDNQWHKGSTFKSEEHATAAIVDRGVRKMLSDRGYEIRDQQVGSYSSSEGFKP